VIGVDAVWLIGDAGLMDARVDPVDHTRLIRLITCNSL
jgi:hypothetical protein